MAPVHSTGESKNDGNNIHIALVKTTLVVLASDKHMRVRSADTEGLGSLEIQLGKMMSPKRGRLSMHNDKTSDTRHGYVPRPLTL